MMQEHVLVFPVALLDKLGRFQGLSFEVERYLGPILDGGNAAFMRRQDAERDTSHKQLIAYVILTHMDTVLAYRRGKLLSEERLLGCYSIGIGGHISTDDPSMFDERYEDAALRELAEEVTLEGHQDLTRVALINDDSDGVGKVHFGIVYVVVLPEPVVRKREKSINEPSFLTVGELRGDLPRFEGWSQICIEHIDEILAKVRISPAKRAPSNRMQSPSTPSES